MYSDKGNISQFISSCSIYSGGVTLRMLLFINFGRMSKIVSCPPKLQEIMVTM